MRKMVYLSVILIWVSTALCVGQNAIDSLEQCLIRHAASDTSRVNLLNQTAFAIRKKNIDKIFKYAYEAKDIALELKYQSGYAESLRMIAIGYYEKYDYPYCITYLQQSLKEYIELHDSVNIALVYLNLGNAYYWANDFQNAIDFYRLSYNIQQLLNDENAMCYCIFRFGLAYRGMHNYDKMVESFDTAIRIAQQLNDNKQLALFYNNMGCEYQMMGNYNQALDYYLNSVDIKLKNNYTSGLNHSYNNIGEVYDRMGEVEKAREYYQKSIDLGNELSDFQAVSNSYLALGLLYNNMDSMQLAILLCDKALQLSVKVGFQYGVVRAYRYLGNIYQKENKWERAFENYNQAIKLADIYLLRDLLAGSYNDLAAMYFEQKEYSKAYAISKKAYQIAMSCSEAEIIKKSAKLIAESSSELGNYKDAFTYLNIYKTMYDSLYNVELLGKLEGLEYKQQYEKDKIMLEHKMEQKDILLAKRQLQTRFMLIILVLVVLFISYAAFDNFKLRAKNKALYLANRSIVRLDLGGVNKIAARNDIEKLKNHDDNLSLDIGLITDLKVKFEIEKIYTDCNLTLEKLADLLNSNRSYLSRIINQEYQCNFNRFINQYRISEARKMLSNPKNDSLTIEGIAQTVGFKSKSVFNTAFKEITGITPSYYRKSVLEEITD